MKRSTKPADAESRDRQAALLKMRFEATIYPGRNAKARDWAEDLDVDRVPDTKGRIRALITVKDLVRLLNGGWKFASTGHTLVSLWIRS